MMIRKMGWLLLLVLGVAQAQTPRWVVMEARGAGLKPGSTLDEKATLNLKEGERVTLIGKDGRTLTVRGVFSGVPAHRDAGVDTAREALSALITQRNDRVKSIGVVRAGLEVGRLPDPWLIDATRGGARCVREGSMPVFWRPNAAGAVAFSLTPADRTWAIDLAWRAGEPTLRLPPTARIAQQNLVQVSVGGEEFPLALNVIPRGVDDPLVQAAWMMEKGCLQQADALLRALSPAEGQ